ncbi:hypothetical protein [Pantoea agglomerans]|uniref:hypothetical protein n=1 Tax=Enterobacter agglomerans TaxID=549 RepID=UPI00244ADCE2|nr:hypothetical protein [Pantoea agglomerans]MDH1171405.1 hypothetical protein [Pantoea agglomerans]
MNAEESQDEIQRRISACVNALEGIPTDRIEGKNLGEILAGEVRLHGAGPRRDGGFGFEFSGGVCQLLAEAYAEQFKQSGAINYLELLFQHSDIGPLTITMQRVDGLTPAQKLAQAENERDSLAAENVALKGFGDTLSEMHAGLEGSGTGFSGEHEAACQQIALDSAMDEFDAIKTPATDTYLNSVRAEGVESLTKILQVMIDAGDFSGDEVGAIAGAIDAGNYHAAQLRAGKDGE